MKEIAVVSAVRTPIGRYGGCLRDVQAQDLAALVVREAINRAGLPPESIDEVILGHCLPNGETPNIARQAALLADLPVETPGYTIDRQCASGLQAVCNAAMQIQTSNGRIIVAGGVESMSNMEHYVVGARWGTGLANPQMWDRWLRGNEMVSTERHGHIQGMIQTAENVAARLHISREEQDELAAMSHQRACAAMEAGSFLEEIVSVSVPQKKGPPVEVTRDEHPRPGTTVELLAKLRPVQGGTVTAGNASGMNDGAAACAVMSRETADELGLEPLGYLRAWAAAAVHPAYMGLGPVPAVKRLLEMTGLSLSDIDLIELNEAFAAQAIGCFRELGIKKLDNVNVNGSGIALGHPVGATGARMLATMLFEMRRRRARLGLATMCVGGGQGLAALFELR